jgi:hypothetical protein
MAAPSPLQKVPHAEASLAFFTIYGPEESETSSDLGDGVS